MHFKNKSSRMGSKIDAIQIQLSTIKNYKERPTLSQKMAREIHNFHFQSFLEQCPMDWGALDITV